MHLNRKLASHKKWGDQDKTIFVLCPQLKWGGREQTRYALYNVINTSEFETEENYFI